MSDDISKRVQELPIEKQKEFSNELFDLLNDRNWCNSRGIYFPNPDVQKAKEILFKEEYQ